MKMVFKPFIFPMQKPNTLFQISHDVLDINMSDRIPKGSEERLRQYQSVISTLGSACYIEGALNSMLFLALEFHEEFEAGVLANANCGGESWSCMYVII